MDIPESLLPLWAMEWLASGFLYAWLFSLGATVGSFLNVVVYRLPRGLNLAYPGSFCPHCRHPIRLSDNVPLLSWLALRGRCRDCQVSISPRYFAVELTVAATFLIVLAGEHFLPPGSFGFAVRPSLLPHDGAPFWCRYAIHVILVTTLIGAALLRADGVRVPARLFCPVLLMGMALPLVWPQVRSVPAWSSRDLSGWHAGLIDGLAGLGAGLVMGALASVLTAPRRWSTLTVIAMGCSIGVVLGWQRTLVGFPVTLVACELASTVVRSLSAASALREVEAQASPAGSASPSEPAAESEAFASAPPSENSDRP